MEGILDDRSFKSQIGVYIGARVGNRAAAQMIEKNFLLQVVYTEEGSSLESTDWEGRKYSSKDTRKEADADLSRHDAVMTPSQGGVWMEKKGWVEQVFWRKGN